MRRREAVAGLGAAALWPGVAEGQGQPPLIGVLRFGDPPDEPFRAPFMRALRDRGYEEGRTILLEWRYAGSRPERAAELAAELVRLPVRVLVAGPTPAALAAKSATRMIPVVILAGDPVGVGLVESLARPGGNVTGVDALAAELNGKRLELIRELVPAAKLFGLLINPSDPFSSSFTRHAELAAGRLGARVLVAPAEQADQVREAFRVLSAARVDAALVQNVFRDQYGMIAELALAHRIPIAGESRILTSVGGLFDLGPTLTEMAAILASLVDRILKGAAPADLPVEQPTRFEFVVNARTAKALGLTLSPALLARADEVIE